MPRKKALVLTDHELRLMEVLCYPVGWSAQHTSACKLPTVTHDRGPRHTFSSTNAPLFYGKPPRFKAAR